jgi:hypothetical protein
VHICIRCFLQAASDADGAADADSNPSDLLVSSIPALAKALTNWLQEAAGKLHKCMPHAVACACCLFVLMYLQGEAIAFALGGNRKMLRAGSLAGLVNQERRAAGCRTAQVSQTLLQIEQHWCSLQAAFAGMMGCQLVRSHYICPTCQGLQDKYKVYGATEKLVPATAACRKDGLLGQHNAM